jgi:D-lactate dehydrogenase
MDLLAPDVHRIAPEGNAPANDRAPDELASGTPEPLRSELIGLLGEDRVLTRVIDLIPCGREPLSAASQGRGDGSRRRRRLEGVRLRARGQVPITFRAGGTA